MRETQQPSPAPGSPATRSADAVSAQRPSGSGSSGRCCGVSQPSPAGRTGRPVQSAVGQTVPLGVVAGVGFRPGTSAVQLSAALEQALDRVALSSRDVATVATLDARLPDPAIQQLAADLAADLVGFPADVLSVQPAPHPAEIVARAVATASVAEAAVLAAGAEILQSKLVLGPVTIALGRRP